MSRGRVVVSLTRRQLAAVRALVSITLDGAGDALDEDLPHLTRVLRELDRAREPLEGRALELVDDLAGLVDMLVEAAAGDEWRQHPILVEADRKASKARAFVKKATKAKLIA